MSVLYVAPEIDELRIPVVGILLAGLKQEKARPIDVDDAVDSAIREISDLGADGLADSVVLQGYRALHQQVGARARDVAAPEVLRRMVNSRGSIRRIGPVVDLYNSVSLRTGLAFGAHDVTGIAGNLTLRLTAGTERFVPLGTETPARVRAGEYAYVDNADDVLCRLEVRQGDKSKVTPSTTNCLVVVQGNPATGIGPVKAAAAAFIELVWLCLHPTAVGIDCM